MARSPRSCERLATLCIFVPLSVPGHVWAHAANLDKELPSLSEYLRLGVEHILTGFDHLAFLIGLVMLPGSLRSLLAAVTAFTCAHSLSLALSVLGVVAPPSVWVETLIALSIAYVALENLLQRTAAARWQISFVFGFVHGFGFASALQEIGVPAERAPAALALFNLGVELGQLSVLGLVLPALRWLRSRPDVWRVSARALNVCLLLLGAGWATERALGAHPVLATEAPGTVAAASDTMVAASSASELRSVYPRNPKRSELAAGLCDALQRLPRQRRAECSAAQSGITLEGECTRLLSAALASGALEVDPVGAESCEQRTRERYATCEFASQVSLAPLSECSALWRGKLAEGATCRSGLECQQGLTCKGVGPFDQGVCTAPKTQGESCGRALDVLAAYLPNDERAHPECAGACIDGRCRETKR